MGGGDSITRAFKRRRRMLSLTSMDLKNAKTVTSNVKGTLGAARDALHRRARAYSAGGSKYNGASRRR